MFLTMKTCHNLFAKCRNPSIQLLAEETGDVVFFVLSPQVLVLSLLENDVLTSFSSNERQMHSWRQVYSCSNNRREYTA